MLLNCQVIAPQSASGVVLDAPEASKLLSAVAIALSNCSWFGCYCVLAQLFLPYVSNIGIYFVKYKNSLTLESMTKESKLNNKL